MGSFDPYPWFVWFFVEANEMNDIVVFCVGLAVSILVVFGIFSRVVQEMHDAKESDEMEQKKRTA